MGEALERAARALIIASADDVEDVDISMELDGDEWCACASAAIEAFLDPEDEALVSIIATEIFTHSGMPFSTMMQEKHQATAVLTALREILQKNGSQGE